MSYTIDEKLKIADNAEKYAGSFVKAVIKAYMLADRINAAKIELAFPEYLEQYLNFGK